MALTVKQEYDEMSSSSSSSGSVGSAKRPVASGGEEGGALIKRPKREHEGGEAASCIALPLGFLEPLSPDRPPQPLPITTVPPPLPPVTMQSFRQFWKAGDYERPPAEPTSVSADMDHVRVHPKFLHSNATSHKWALGALAELLDNSLDEVCNGATYVSLDMLENQKDGSRMLLVEDDGGGMDPDKLRQCMSLGYSVKSRLANTIGQYGNGFKTSTMRLGADVIVFSRCRGKEGRSPTQSIGMLSYTFLRSTGKEDIVVPMIDYEKGGKDWNKMERSTSFLWDTNLETILKWSPYFTKAELLQQFCSMTDQGTRIVIYNLWEDDQGELELDFDADKHDIQIRGVNRDDRKIEKAKQFPNSRHFLTYRHSLRSYASILYLRLPPGFRMILRGKEIEHHNIVDDMMLTQEKAYRPQSGGDGTQRDPNMIAVVTVGFVKDAKDHINVQGFNVYHKNRLIKPFWRVWNAAGSDGRGVIGVLEANFVEPAHDKQGFERTTVLSRLEARLIQMQKAYWKSNCHTIGYAPRHSKKLINWSVDKESLSEASRQLSFLDSKKEDSTTYQNKCKSSLHLNHKMRETNATPIVSTKMGDSRITNGHLCSVREIGRNIHSSSPQPTLYERPHTRDGSDPEIECISIRSPNDSRGPGIDFIQKSLHKESAHPSPSSPHFMHNEVHAWNGCEGIDQTTTRLNSEVTSVMCNGNGHSIEGSHLSLKQLNDQTRAWKSRLDKLEELSHELKCVNERNKSLAAQLEVAERKVEELSKEQEALIDVFSEERCRRDVEEENLRKKLKEASTTIQVLTEKLNSCQNHGKAEC